MPDLLFWALGLGSMAAGFTVAVRALSVVQALMWQQKKPWACDICMSFWSVGLFGLALAAWQGPELLAACGPAYPVALLLLRRLQEPQHPPLPPLE